MKIEKIHLNKLKVTLSPEDLIENNITPEKVRDNSPSVQEVLMKVVRRAEEEFGFEAENARLMVEAMPGEDDSMVMYITKLSNEDDLKDAVRTVRKRLRLKVRNAPSDDDKICISFDDFEDAVRLSQFTALDEGGELYFYQGKYHLIISCGEANHFSEFGKAISDEQVCDLVAEHGKLVSDNALKMLRQYF